MRFYLALFYLYLLSCPQTEAFRIISEHDTPVIVNGGREETDHEVTMLMDRSDERLVPGTGVPLQVYNPSNPSELLKTYRIRNAGPAYRYGVVPQEYLPEATLNFYGLHCLVFNDDVNFAKLQEVYAHPTTPSVIRSRIRLKIGSMQRKVNVLRKLIYKQRNPFLIAGLAFVAGAATGYLISRAFGSGGDFQSKFDMIDASLRKIGTQLRNFDDFVKKTNQRVENQAANIDLANANIGRLQDQLDVVRGDVAKAFDHINNIVNITQLMQQQEQNDFALVESQLLSITNGSSALQDYTRQLATVTKQQVGALAEAIANTDAQLQQVNIQMYNFMQDLYMRRGVIRNFWDHVDDDTGEASRPFVENIGQPPMSDDQINALSTINQAKLIGRMRVSYTLTSGSGKTAVERILSYSCDPLQISTNVMPRSTFRSLFQQLGPDDGGNGTYCYDPYGSANTRWNCSCAIILEEYTCTLSTSKLYPWDWSNNTASLSLSEEAYGLCGNQNPQKTSLALVDNLPTQSNVFTSMNAWYTWFRNFCGTLPFVASTNNATKGMKWRVYSDLHDAWQDFSLNGTTTSDVCSPDISFFLNQDNNVQRPAYAIYSFWKLSYDQNQRYALLELQKSLYGVMTSNVDEEPRLFATHPSDADTARCHYFYYTKVSDKKVTLYQVDPLSIEHVVYVSADDGPEVPVVLNGTGITQIPLTDGGRPATAESQLILSTDFSNLLPGSFKMVGPFIDFSSEPPKLYDVPFADIGDGTPSSRRHKVNWLYQKLRHGPDALITAATYLNDTANSYMPRYLGDSPVDYARTVVQVPGGKYLCADAFDAHNQVVPVLGANKDLCTQMKFFRMNLDTTNPDQMILTYRPDSYTISVSLKLPSGIYKQQIATSCPSNYSITKADDQWVFSFFTTQVEPSTIIVKISKFNQQVQCAPEGPFTYSYWAGNPASHALAACGQMYINVYMYDSDLPCYAEPGISADVEHRAVDGPVVPSYVRQAITYSADIGLQQAVLIDGALSSLRYQMSSLPYKYWSSLDAFDQAVTDNLNRQQEIYVQIRVNASGEAQKAIDNEIARLQNDTQQVIDNQRILLQYAQDVRAALAISANYSRLEALYANQSRELAKRIDVQQDDLEDTIRRTNDIKVSTDCNSQSGIFGAITCTVKNAFSNMFSSIGSFFGVLLNIAFYVLLFVLLLCCLGPCIRVLAPVLQSSFTSVTSAVKDVSKPKETPTSPRPQRSMFSRVPEIDSQ